MPFALLNCSSGDGDDDPTSAAASTTGGSTTTSSGTPTSTSSTGASSTGVTDPTTSTTAGSGGGDASSSTSNAGSGGGDASSSVAGTGGAGASTGEGGSGGTPSGEFTIASTSHQEGAEFADKYTCAAAGFNGSLMPELHWTPGPAGTKSYAITFIDVTLTTQTPPSDLGYHWVVYNIPANVTSLPEEFKNTAAIGPNVKQNSNYLGPCPNFGSSGQNHTYEFTIYALDTETVTITGSSTGAVKDAEKKLEMNHLAKAKLTGTSDASPP